jgi:hypothetical protein
MDETNAELRASLAAMTQMIAALQVSVEDANERSIRDGVQNQREDLGGEAVTAMTDLTDL